MALPPSCCLHPVFHVSRLKRVVPPQQQLQELPIGLSKDVVLQAKPDQLLHIHINSSGDIEVSVKWLNLPDCENDRNLAIGDRNRGKLVLIH